MFKFLTCFIFYLCCLLFSSEPVYCQENSTQADTVDINDLPISDTAWLPGILRQVPDGKWKEYRHDPDFAYANDSAYWKKAPPEEPSLLNRFYKRVLLNRVVRTCIFILFLLLIAYAIYRLAKENSFRWFARNGAKNKAHEMKEEQAQLTGIDLDEAIRKYREAGNFSLTVRYMYLKLLHTAFEKNAIPSFRPSSTDSDIAVTFRDPRQAADFRFLASAYEYVFYGGFIPSREQFDLLQKRFHALQENLES